MLCLDCSSRGYYSEHQAISFVGEGDVVISFCCFNNDLIVDIKIHTTCWHEYLFWKGRTMLPTSSMLPKYKNS